MSTHTKGPWEVHEDEILSADGGWIATVFFADDFPEMDDDRRGVVNDEAEANCRLIACAPELLEALADLVKTEEEYGDPNNAAVNESWLKARAVIARATGAA